MRRPVGGRLERERRRAGREEGGGDHEPALRRRRVGPERRVLRAGEITGEAQGVQGDSLILALDPRLIFRVTGRSSSRRPHAGFVDERLRFGASSRRAVVVVAAVVVAEEVVVRREVVPEIRPTSPRPRSDRHARRPDHPDTRACSPGRATACRGRRPTLGKWRRGPGPSRWPRAP